MSPGRISKIGDGGVRTALYEAANVILTRPVKGSTLKSWGMRLAARAGMRKAKVALARKLEEGDEDVRLNACLNLVKDRPDRQVASRLRGGRLLRFLNASSTATSSR